MSQPDWKSQKSKATGSATALKYALPIAAFVLLVGGMSLWFARSNQQPADSPIVDRVQLPAANQEQGATSSNAAVTLTPAPENWRETTHIHGLAVNPVNPAVAYIATHHGLLQRSETGQWFWMGKQRADYMGFTADPTNPNRFYSSGHPPTGGNLGFQISNNQGQDWKQISLPGVDFHALAIAPSNPNIFYGWPASGAQGLHVSTDGGKTWTQPRMVGLGDAPFSLAVDPQNSDRVFATTRSGLYESTDSGNNWTLVPNTQNAPVVGFTLLKQGNSSVTIGYRVLKSAPGLYRSTDNGKTWQPLGSGTNGTILYLAIAPSNPQVLYAVNENNAVFQSLNGGKTWKELE
ncbi:F510_1955 family glycosylhydrolase [Chroococcidiopsis sp. CCNUC1]|uniref:F510_1955 family glycosylhydrolase n=1 Tax=Chroococcidiopsis sp. CCNUC1 TaxID=2653189 RepID=UPI002020DA90|nr:YCF48-related protein [Chroococcidiopsis sp. CCNUC1]URD53399.1 YCF48-related protein [Chroococcidiopsis sp. CCNUC1]